MARRAGRVDGRLSVRGEPDARAGLDPCGSKFLTLGFRDLGLRSVNTWVVDGNPSRRIVERLGFRYAGRLRQCHLIDDRPRDRLLFDLLASEHRELDKERWRRLE